MMKMLVASFLKFKERTPRLDSQDSFNNPGLYIVSPSPLLSSLFPNFEKLSSLLL